MNSAVRSLWTSLYPSCISPKLNLRGFLRIGARNKGINASRNVISWNYPAIFEQACNRGFTSAGQGLETLSWDDHEDIAELLREEYPSTNPLNLRFTELHDNVTDIVLTSTSKPITGTCSEGALEKIQMAWLELCEDNDS